MAYGAMTGGDVYDFAATPFGTAILASTAQYAAVYVVDTTTNDSFQVAVVNTTLVEGQAVGINQTLLSTGADVNVSGVRVRFHGISKALAATNTCVAGSWLLAVGTTTNGGRLKPNVALASMTHTSIITTTSFTNVVGQALQSANTAGAHFAVFVQPHLRERQFA